MEHYIISEETLKELITSNFREALEDYYFSDETVAEIAQKQINNLIAENKIHTVIYGYDTKHEKSIIKEI